jgi:hypothetical protein
MASGGSRDLCDVYNALDDTYKFKIVIEGN